MTTDLIRYDAMRRELETCARLDEAAEIKDKAAALQAYARQRHDRDLEIWTAEIKQRAAQRIGELSQDLDVSSGGANPAATLLTGEKTKRQAIEEAGLSVPTAYRYEELAGHRKYGTP